MWFGCHLGLRRGAPWEGGGGRSCCCDAAVEVTGEKGRRGLLGNMRMNVQCARGPAGVGAEGTQRAEGPAPQEAGAVPHLLCVCELLYNYRRPFVGSTSHPTRPPTP